MHRAPNPAVLARKNLQQHYCATSNFAYSGRKAVHLHGLLFALIH
ncbi:hypothetical protein BSU04_38505 [Caballeronia sordidicola]|uniref:Uncharacterized protein n=1 Tax=Caballeronia sordidicola TaxID=196367 RepID=A0A226WQY9_CABSO|nr:hypothetical protein BSU04_38505 [Caballeronia sordidicola]